VISHHPSFLGHTVRKLYEAETDAEPGRAGQRDGTRELPMTPLPYVIVYGADLNTVRIFRILHAAQDRS
jgi:plasmid stabilization system protein ParE